MSSWTRRKDDRRLRCGRAWKKERVIKETPDLLKWATINFAFWICIIKACNVMNVMKLLTSSFWVFEEQWRGVDFHHSAEAKDGQKASSEQW